MQFGLSESQQILKDTARKFFAGEIPIAAVRKAMETETAYDAGLWTKLAEQDPDLTLDIPKSNDKEMKATLKRDMAISNLVGF